MRSVSLAAPIVGLVLATVAAFGQSSAPQQRLPYAAVHDPQFTAASDATFMHDPDRVIGVMSGSTAKAFPAGILAQHGLVEDETPSGPIAVTW
jgi:hypothetical protein